MDFEKPVIILADAGPYSLEILRWLFYVNMDFIPSTWTKEELILMMNIRSEIERQFSHNTVVYHARRAKCFRARDGAQTSIFNFNFRPSQN